MQAKALDQAADLTGVLPGKHRSEMAILEAADRELAGDNGLEQPRSSPSKRLKPR